VQNFAAQPKSYFRNFYRTSTCWYAKLYRAQSWYGSLCIIPYVCPGPPRAITGPGSNTFSGPPCTTPV